MVFRNVKKTQAIAYLEQTSMTPAEIAKVLKCNIATVYRAKVHLLQAKNKTLAQRVGDLESRLRTCENQMADMAVSLSNLRKSGTDFKSRDPMRTSDLGLRC